MKRAWAAFAFLACAATAGSAWGGEPIAVIVNQKNPVSSITNGDLRKIYEDRMLKWGNGIPITVYELAVNDPMREEFSGIIFGVPAGRVAEMWAHLKITNQAKNPPINLKSQITILKKVAAEEGAIGYVSMNAVREADTQRVKVLTTLQQ